MTGQQKSRIKENLPAVAVIIIVVAILVVLGLILLASPAENENQNLDNTAQTNNQNTNTQILIPIKNDVHKSIEPLNANTPFFLTNEGEDDHPVSLEQTYSNSDYKFSISYPGEYLVQEDVQPVGAVFSVSFVTFAEDLPIVTLYEGKALTSEIENALAQSISTSIEIEKKTYANIEATLISTPSSDATDAAPAKRTIWEYNNYLFELTGAKSDDLRDRMLNSFATFE